jgi:hypothetical protein
MARNISNTLNRTARILPASDKAITQAWVPLSTLAGLLLDSKGARGLVPDSIASLVEAFLSRFPLGTFGAVAHGMRAVVDSVQGNGAPFFLERNGVGSGSIYMFNMYGKVEKASAFLASLGGIGGPNVATFSQEGTKPGARMTLQANADIEAVLTAMLACQATGRNEAWNTGMGPTTLVVDDTASMTVDAPVVEAAPVSKRAEKRARKAAASA